MSEFCPEEGKAKVTLACFSWFSSFWSLWRMFHLHLAFSSCIHNPEVYFLSNTARNHVWRQTWGQVCFKSAKLASIPRAHIIEGTNWLPKTILSLPRVSHYLCAHTHINKCTQNNFKIIIVLIGLSNKYLSPPLPNTLNGAITQILSKHPEKKSQWYAVSNQKTCWIHSLILGSRVKLQSLYGPEPAWVLHGGY